jgi:phosphoribosylformimino-5-aminoimidazole carboxamide ribotide isomerase
LHIIPVIDLLNGQVVHARHGDRANYQPIQSQLCPSSEPLAMVDALLALYPFKKLYIADLNAIQGMGNHQATISQIKQCYPQLNLLVDAGFKELAAIECLRAQHIDIVIGSESLRDIAHYQILLSACDNRAVLSLDFKENQYQGPVELSQSATLWPDHVIVMTLSKVGSQLGPDLEKINTIKMLADQKNSILKSQNINILAAGGVRNHEDLTTLKALGISGALVASALHAGHINPSEFYGK